MKKKGRQMRINRKKPLMIIMKLILTLLTAVFSMFMVIMTGSGLIYNSESYGPEMRSLGIVFIAAAALMGLGNLFIWLKMNVFSLISSSTGFIMCMMSLYKLKNHADAAGWSDKYTMEPISSMYVQRIMPVIIPFLLAVIIALMQFFSYEAAEKRRIRKDEKKKKEDAPSPPII
ncbi:MAG: hypothetical protein ACI4JE_06450 [Ruminococcus sp.]